MNLLHKENVSQRLLLIFSIPILFLFSGHASAVENHNTSSKNSGSFEATISGAYSGNVSGKGVLKYIPSCGFEKQGCFFLADGRGIRPHGVTFILPNDMSAGKHKLKNPSPLESGTVLSVRVDRDMGNSVGSYEKNTSGYLELTKFPGEKEKPKNSRVSGNFQFSTEDSKGKKITVKGNFSFTAK